MYIVHIHVLTDDVSEVVHCLLEDPLLTAGAEREGEGKEQLRGSL